MRNPIARGSALAVAAAVLFGATAPLVKHFGASVGAFATAALLYGGAMLGAGWPKRRAAEAAVRRSHAPRLLAVALFGAALGPACLAWGLQHAGALQSSLLLNLEAVFTIALARVLYREPIGRRVAVASTLMVLGGGLLAARGGGAGKTELVGVAAVTATTFFWALDNALTRPLADLDPSAVVFWKALFGAALSVAVALAMQDRWPSVASSAALLACGALGFGVSLRLYLRAQRVLGAARTGSLFAVGPFVGAALAFAAGERHGGALVALAAGVFGVAVWLHATERHRHRHRHGRLEHEHAHRHDDGHHTHAHQPPVTGAHTHGHVHEPQEHAHAHGADSHHVHAHD